MGPRVTIAHEWLVSYAGSERCVEEMLALYPDATLLTTIVDPARVPVTLRHAKPSPLQWLPGAAHHHEWLVPLMPLAWRLGPRPLDVDVVISSSHACAKAVRTPAAVPHICYCHTPMRYAWDFAAERSRFPIAVRPLAQAGMAWFRRWDRESARHVTRFVANSTAVAERIWRAYGRAADVIHPPVRTDFFTPGAQPPGNYFLFVGRMVGYKRAEVAAAAFDGQPHRLVMVGERPRRSGLSAHVPDNVELVGHVDDAELRELYRSAIALVHPGAEDFGIGMAEAQACGTPVIAPAAGGALDIVEPGRTGWLVENGDAYAWRQAISRAAAEQLDRSEIARSAARFSAARFRSEIKAVVDAELDRRGGGR
jgi:glycosyltransferase involved in cell wall biosynthesis